MSDINGNGGGDGNGNGYSNGNGFSNGFSNAPTVSLYASDDNLPALLRVASLIAGDN
jgi:hypothetical protein